jgi:hypothetical protein
MAFSKQTSKAVGIKRPLLQTIQNSKRMRRTFQYIDSDSTGMFTSHFYVIKWSLNHTSSRQDILHLSGTVNIYSNPAHAWGFEYCTIFSWIFVFPLYKFGWLNVPMWSHWEGPYIYTFIVQFTVLNGLKHGDALSPLLFKFALNMLFKAGGVKIEVFHNFWCLPVY